MKQKLAKFMYGRYGVDEFSRFLTYFLLLLILISMSFNSYVKTAIFTLAVLTAVYTYFRIFSKNLDKRRSENARYLNHKNRITSRLNLRRDIWKQRKEYKFFKCPSCKAVLRVPKGKGKIRVVCKKCGTAFEKKT